MNQELLYSMASGVYDAALMPERWSNVLEEMGRAFGASAVNISILDDRGRPTKFLTRGTPPQLQRLFLHKYSRPDLNTFAATWAAKPVGALIKSWESPEFRTFRDSEMYNELYKPIGAYKCIGVVLARGAHNLAFGMLLPEDGRPFGDSESHLASALVPHLQRALQVSLKLDVFEHERRLFADMLDQVSSVGIVLVNEGGAVIWANSAAEELARQRDGFAIKPSGIAVASPDVTRQLKLAIATAAGIASGEGLAQGATVQLSRPSGRRPMLATVMPMRTAEWVLPPPQPAAIVLISDPEREVLPPPQRLASIFKLTLREAQIAALLAQGAGLADAAERLGLSRATVQTHLKRILEKTGTHRQAELVSLLLRAMAGFRH